MRRKARYINEDACTGRGIFLRSRSHLDGSVRVRLGPAYPPRRLQVVPAGRAGRSRLSTSRHPAVHLSPPGPDVKAHGYVSLVKEGRVRKVFASRWTRPAGGEVLAGPATRSARPSVPGRAGGPAADPAAEALHRRRPLRPGRARGIVASPNGKRAASAPAGRATAAGTSRPGYLVKIFEAADRPWRDAHAGHLD